MKTGILVRTISTAAFLCWLAVGHAADALAPAIQAKIDKELKGIQALAQDPVLVAAVREQNAKAPADCAAMTQEKWQSLTILDPVVRSFSKNPVGGLLKAKKSPAVSEAFVSDAAGMKVAFLSKTTAWNHKGKPKHDVPMTGKTWQGPIEVDESSGLQQLQVAVPVLDGDKPIGSLVVGLSLARLEKD